MQAGIKPATPKQLNGLRVGDRVKTALGRTAVIKRIRQDGFLDAVYENRCPTLAEVILQPKHCTKLD